MGHHFNGNDCSIQNLVFFPIDTVEEHLSNREAETRLKRLETHWIKKMCSLHLTSDLISFVGDLMAFEGDLRLYCNFTGQVHAQGDLKLYFMIPHHILRWPLAGDLKLFSRQPHVTLHHLMVTACHLSVTCLWKLMYYLTSNVGYAFPVSCSSWF